MCGTGPDEKQLALHRWTWSARWQITHFAQDNYARLGRGIVVIRRSRAIPPVTPNVESQIPKREIAYYTPEAVRELRPTKRVTAQDLQGWIESAKTYNPTTHWSGVMIVAGLRVSSLLAPLTTLASDARLRFSGALRQRPLPLDVVHAAARRYYEELRASGYPLREIESQGREEMTGYRYCFTHYDKEPLFGLQVAAAIAEGFRIEWRLVKDEGPRALTSA